MNSQMLLGVLGMSFQMPVLVAMASAATLVYMIGRSNIAKPAQQEEAAA
jgi:Sec-independent protein secretion pathway component TatC